MLMRSVTRLPGLRFRLLLPLLLATLALHVCAQNPDDEDDDDDVPAGTFANVTLKYDARGTADVSFYAYGDLQGRNGIAAQLEQAFRCPTGSLANPPADPKLPKYLASQPAKEQERYREYREKMRKNTLQGQCPAAMTRTGLLLSTDIPLEGLTAELRHAGVTKFSIYLWYPKSKFSDVTRGIRGSQNADSSGTPTSAAYNASSWQNYVVDTAAPSLSRIHVAFGLRNRDAVRAVILPLAFLVAPILICLWMSWAALRDANTDPTGAWFSYFRVLTWCGNCLILIWMMGQTVRQGLELVLSYYTAARTAGAVLLEVGILILPPWLAFFTCILLSYRVYRHVRGEAWTRRDFFLNQSLGVASQFLPLAFFFAGMGMISISGQASVALFAGVYISYVLCKWLHAKYSGLHIEPLSQGELRDRVFEIAKKAAVEVRGVFIVPAGKSQMANAFASRNHMVMFTDYLLSRFSKREVSAIAAHEVAHIQRKHPAWRSAAFIVLIFSSQILYGFLSSFVSFLRHGLQARQAADGPNSAPGLATVVHFGDQILAFPELILILFAIALFLYHLQSQHFEYVADAGALQFTGDPEAMITSLLKLSRLNLTPVQWDRATGSLLTHPSTLKRVQRIAMLGQVPTERLQQLMKEGVDPRTQAAEPEVWQAGEQFQVAHPVDPVVTLRSASGELALKKWVLRLAVICPTATIAWTVSHFHLQHKITIFGVGSLLCLALYAVVGEWQATWFRERLKRKFMARLASEGVGIEDQDVLMVALSPHSMPRVYALGFTWDTGGLFMGDDRLCYVGDQIRFALQREQVVGVRLGQGVPDWIGEPRTYIEWQPAPDSPIQRWNLLPKDPYYASGNKKQCIELAAKLERWRSRRAEYPEVPLSLKGLSLPGTGEITSQRLKAVIGFGRFVKAALFGQVLALVVCIVARIPSAWFVCLVELLAAVYSYSPFWFYKEPDDAQTMKADVLGTQPAD